jgi:hypothetical protein
MNQHLERPARPAEPTVVAEAAAGAPTPRPVLRRRAAAGAALALAGGALFAYVLARTGFEAIARGATRVGWAFVLVLALSGLRYLIRALAWIRCAGRPRLPLATAFQAMLVGDALGNLTPLGLLASEPAKVALARTAVPWPQALSALAVETFFYTLSVIAIIVAGLLLLPLAMRTSLAWGLTAGAGVLLLGAGALAGDFLLGGRFARLSRAIGWLDAHRLLPPAVGRHRAALERFEARLFDLYAASRANVLPLLLLETSFHLAALAETYLVLALVTGGRPTLVTALLFESANRFITAVFKFVPLRLGVEEAGTALFAGALHLEPAVGVALALVRKGRVVCWTMVGLALLARRGALTARAPASTQART